MENNNNGNGNRNPAAAKHPEFNLDDPATIVLDGPLKMTAFHINPETKSFDRVRMWNSADQVTEPPPIELIFENAIALCDFYRVNFQAAAGIAIKLLIAEGVGRVDAMKRILCDLYPEDSAGLYDRDGRPLKR